MSEQAEDTPSLSSPVLEAGLLGRMIGPSAEHGTDEVAASDTWGFAAPGQDLPTLILRDLGDRSLDDVGLPAHEVHTLGGTEARRYFEDGRVSVVFRSEASANAYLVTGDDAKADEMLQFASELLAQMDLGVEISVPMSIRSWTLSGEADATSYWALFSPSGQPGPIGSVRYTWHDPDDEGRTLSISITDGGAEEAGVLRALIPPGVPVENMSWSDSPGHLSCAAEPCDAGAGVFSLDSATITIQWSGVPVEEIATALQAMRFE